MASRTMLSVFERVDNALADYYQSLGYSNYRDADGKGLFLNYIISEELNDPALPIRDELGDDCDPSDCAYSWMYHDAEFPIPDYAVIPEAQKEAFIFYVVQYCYKFDKPPSRRFIEQILVPRCNGQIVDAKSTSTKLSSDTPSNSNRSISTLNIAIDEKDDESKKGAIRLSQRPFDCGSTSNALRISIPTNKLSAIRNAIDRRFDSDSDFMHYAKSSTMMQLHDGALNEFTVRPLHSDSNGPPVTLCPVHYDLRSGSSPKETVYGIMIRRRERDEWRWRLDDSLTAKQILNRFGIALHELPRSSRDNAHFKAMLNEPLVIEQRLIDDTLWHSVPQKATKIEPDDDGDRGNGNGGVSVSLTLSESTWKEAVKRSFSDIDLPLIPVVVVSDSRHWIEWVKTVHVESRHLVLGVSCKKEGSRWTVQSIVLDKRAIERHHNLVGLRSTDRHQNQFQQFGPRITSVHFADHNEVEEIAQSATEKALKRQIEQLKDSVLRASAAASSNNEHSNKNGHNGFVAVQQSVAQFIRRKYADRERVNSMKRNHLNSNHHSMKRVAVKKNVSSSSSSSAQDNDDWLDLDQLVDDVVKEYEVMSFRTKPVGVKKTIVIDPEVTRRWKDAVSPAPADSTAFYFWIDETAAMQMIQGLSRQYVARQSRKFLAAVINLELSAIGMGTANGEPLYGVICCDDELRDKYRYKMARIWTADQIWKKYGIHCRDLPRPSRAEPELLEQLRLKRPLCRRDIESIDWNALKLLRSATQSESDRATAGKVEGPSAASMRIADLRAVAVSSMHLRSVAIAESVMVQYGEIAVDRLLQFGGRRECKDYLVPILVVDKVAEYVAMEWVLCIHLIHRNVHCALSFRYEPKLDSFTATAVYSECGPIESRHRLIGLDPDSGPWPVGMQPFYPPLCTLRIVPDAPNGLDADPFDPMSYARPIDAEQSRNRALQLQLQNATKMLDALKRENMALRSCAGGMMPDNSMPPLPPQQPPPPPQQPQPQQMMAMPMPQQMPQPMQYNRPMASPYFQPNGSMFGPLQPHPEQFGFGMNGGGW